MNYQIDGKNLLFAIDRAAIIDISVNDTLEVKDLPGATYTWTDQDREFMENNPDDEIFLQIERRGNQYIAKGILLKAQV
jgi:hypothetical protein